MDLINYENFKNISNCPLENQSGELKLYRWVKKNDFNNSFTPHGFKERFKNNCLAWGLSTFNSEKSALEILNNLPAKKRKEFNAIAFCSISDENGIKHQSGSSVNHYTFYPSKEFDVFGNFQIIENEN